MVIDFTRAILETSLDKRRAIAVAEVLRQTNGASFSLPTEGLSPQFFRALADELKAGAKEEADFANTRGKMVIDYCAARDKAGAIPELRQAYREFQHQFPAQNVTRFSMGETLRLLGYEFKPCSLGVRGKSSVLI